MKKLLFLCIALFLFANEAILKLDTKGHIGIIRDILVTKNADIISASDDKTIRVWGSDGIEKRKILGEIGTGYNGKIYAIALSPNEKYLAVGGQFGNDINHFGNIRIYNYKSGKLIKLLKSHTNVVEDLAFSNNGKYLISGSIDKTAKIWDMDSFTLLDTIKTHIKAIYGVKAIDNRYAITVGLDGKIDMYDMQNHYSLKSHNLNDMLQFLAINRIKRQIAVCGNNNQINIYDYNLNHIKTIYGNHKFKGLNYSKDGKYLIAGAGSRPLNVNIYETDNYSLYNSFQKFHNLVQTVNFINDKLAVSGGGNNNEIYIFNFHTGKVIKKIVGVGQSIWSVGINGDKIAWLNIDYQKKQYLLKYINLKSFKIKSIKTKTTLKNFKIIKTINGNYSLTNSKGGPYGYNKAVLNIKYNGKTVHKIVKNTYNGLRNNCYGWYKNYIISGGSNGDLRIYDINGKEIANLVGHTGEIWSIAVDGDILVSGSQDQTIKLWDLSKISDNLEYNEKLISLIMNKYHITRQRVIQITKQKHINLYKIPKFYPLLTIFVSKNNDYIVWTKSGYFASSVNGTKYIGYHINQGYNKEARWVGVDKYFNTFYRPDIIKYILQTHSETQAIAFANQNKRVKKVDILNSLPPEVILLSDDEIHTSKNSITIKYKVKSKTPIKEMIITQNGNRINQRGLKINNGIKYLTIDLVNGLNLISIKARNKDALSNEILVKIYKKGKKLSIYKPTLYLLAVGVSKYKNPEYDLGVADKDAISIAKFFKSQQGKLYKKVVTKVLTNQNATDGNILDALDWLDSEVTSKDVAMIFIAGHGINDDKGNYYFLPYNANLKHLRRTGVQWSEIQDTISDLPSKVIVMADTCHSGNITGGKKRDITSAISSIINSGSGAVIFTATTSRGYSYEKAKWGHGAFTLSILDGLKGKADYDGNGDVSIKELDLYITTKVKQLTNGKQKPTTIVPHSIPDFAVSVD